MSRRPLGYEDADADMISPDLRRRLNQAISRKVWPFYLYGPVGTGKTCAAAVMFGAATRLPLWFRADDLLQNMSFGRGNGVRIEQMGLLRDRAFRTLPWDKFSARMNDAPCVFLDDLAVRKPTEAMQQSLFDLFEWRRGKPFVITSNKSPEELTLLYDERILSRVNAGTVIEVSGTDRRRGTGFRVKAAGE